MIFNIRLYILILSLTTCSLIQAQNDSIASKIDTRLRSNVIDIYIQNGNPTGDNFAGKGLDGGFGFGFRSQWYVKKGFYLGGALSWDFMSVDDILVVGDYRNVTKFNTYLFAGYDYQWNEKFHFTGDIGVGYSQNKNFVNTSLDRFRDSGTLLRLTTSFEYMSGPRFSVFISPSFEMVDYKIQSAASLGNRFNNGNYFNIAIGARFTTPAISNELSGLSKLERDIARIEQIPEENRNGQQRIRLKILKKRLNRRQRRD